MRMQRDGGHLHARERDLRRNQDFLHLAEQDQSSGGKANTDRGLLQTHGGVTFGVCVCVRARMGGLATAVSVSARRTLLT